MKIEQYIAVREKVASYSVDKELTGPQDVDDFLRYTVGIGKYDREHFFTFCLNSKGKIVSFEDEAVGVGWQVLVDVSSILRTAILASAHSIIVAHNHPSGDPAPSDQDIYMTRRLKEACEIMDIKLADHVVVGDRYYSFCQEEAL